eukprot:6492294-Amphidinium_carterae.2
MFYQHTKDEHLTEIGVHDLLEKEANGLCPLMALDDFVESKLKVSQAGADEDVAEASVFNPLNEAGVRLVGEAAGFVDTSTEATNTVSKYKCSMDLTQTPPPKTAATSPMPPPSINRSNSAQSVVSRADDDVGDGGESSIITDVDGDEDTAGYT